MVCNEVYRVASGCDTLKRPERAGLLQPIFAETPPFLGGVSLYLKRTSDLLVIHEWSVGDRASDLLVTRVYNISKNRILRRKKRRFRSFKGGDNSLDKKSNERYTLIRKVEH